MLEYPDTRFCLQESHGCRSKADFAISFASVRDRDPGCGSGVGAHATKAPFAGWCESICATHACTGCWIRWTSVSRCWRAFSFAPRLGQYEVDTPEQLLNLLTTIRGTSSTNQAHRLRAQRRDIRRDAASASRPSGQSLPRRSDPSEQASAKEILEKVRDRLDDDERYLAEQTITGSGLARTRG